MRHGAWLPNCSSRGLGNISVFMSDSHVAPCRFVGSFVSGEIGLVQQTLLVPGGILIRSVATRLTLAGPDRYSKSMEMASWSSGCLRVTSLLVSPCRKPVLRIKSFPMKKGWPRFLTTNALYGNSKLTSAFESLNWMWNSAMPIGAVAAPAKAAEIDGDSPGGEGVKPMVVVACNRWRSASDMRPSEQQLSHTASTGSLCAAFAPMAIGI